MSNPSHVILVGAFSEIIELCEEAGIDIVGLIDEPHHGTHHRHRVLGTDVDAPRILAEYPAVPVHITPDLPALRRQLVEHYRVLGATFATLIHPSAIVSPTALLADGCVIQAGAHVSSGARLGLCVKVNTCANITHDVEIGDFATIAPSAVLLGRCRIATCAYIGANATVLPARCIGKDAIVGAGTTITHDVPDGAVFVGAPGRPR